MPQIDDKMLFDFQVYAVEGGVKWELYVPQVLYPLFSGWAPDTGDLHAQMHKALSGVQEWYEQVVRKTPGGRPHSPGR